MNPDLRLLGGGSKQHGADANKSYQEPGLISSAICKQERYSKEDQGWDVVQDRNPEVPSEEKNHDAICEEDRDCSGVDVPGYRTRKLQSRTYLNTAESSNPNDDQSQWPQNGISMGTLVQKEAMDRATRYCRYRY